MADIIAYQSGDWTGATTWKGTATSTGAKQTSTASTTNSTTSYVYSPTFTVTNGVVIEGVLIYCRRANTTGTFSVALSDNNGTTATREVTVNTADLPSSLSWVFFKFGTTLTGDGGTDYRVGIRSSSSSSVTVGRSATTADWARYLRTNSTATIAASDVTFVCDELTGAGAKTDIEVTMNSTASTAYGECNIGAGGILSYGTSASTNYILDLAGNLNVWGGGTLNIGTSGTRIPSTSTALLEFTNASNVQYGLEVRDGGTCNMYGAVKSNTKTLLTSDAASGQAVVNVTSTTDWATNDVIAIAPTTFTPTQAEKLTISVVNSSTQATMTSNLSFSHTGTSPYVGEVVNLTRNVKVRGTSQTLCAYATVYNGGTLYSEYTEFYWLGSATTNKRGIENQSPASNGTTTLKFCSMYDYFATGGAAVSATNSGHTTVVDDCVFYWTTSSSPISWSTTGGSPSFQNNYVIGTQQTVSIADAGTLVKNNRIAGCGLSVTEIGVPVTDVSDNVVHSATNFILFNCSGTIVRLTSWRNSSNLELRIGGATFEDCVFYHGSTSNILATTSSPGLTRFVNCSFDGGSGSGLSNTSTHFYFGLTVNGVVFDSCSIGTGTTAGGFMTVAPSRQEAYDVLFRNCTIADTVTITNQSNLFDYKEFSSSIKFDKFNNTSGSHRTYKKYGRTESDQSVYNTAAPSEALLPNTSGEKLPSGSKRFAVASGTTATVSVYVRKSATYTGNQPRLILKSNSIAGITTDTVLDTMSSGTEVWEELSGTTATVSDDCVLEVYVDCDGTAGTVNVDDWSVN